jgi:hypothetical protein
MLCKEWGRDRFLTYARNMGYLYWRLMQSLLAEPPPLES